MMRAIFFLAGVAAGAIAGTRRDRGATDSSGAELQQKVTELEATITVQQSETSERFARVESRLEEHSAKLAEIPSTAQIVGAMEQVLARSMASLDERLASQAHSIDVLRGAVSQTDSLLERVLESVDSLQAYTEPPETIADGVLHRAPV